MRLTENKEISFKPVEIVANLVGLPFLRNSGEMLVSRWPGWDVSDEAPGDVWVGAATTLVDSLPIFKGLSEVEAHGPPLVLPLPGEGSRDSADGFESLVPIGFSVPDS